MARPRRTESDPEADSARPVDPAGADAGAATDAGEEFDPIAEALAQLGADTGAYVLIHRLETHGSKTGWAYVGRYEASTFNIDDIRDRYKEGGCYRAAFVKSNGKTHCQRQFLVSASPTAAPAAPQVSSQGHQAVGAASSSLIEQLVLKSFEGTQTLLAALITAIAGGGGGVKGADLIAAFREGREATGGTKTGLTEALEAIKIGAELGGTAAPAADADPLLTVAGPLLNLVDKMLHRTGESSPVRSSLPGRTSVAPSGAVLTSAMPVPQTPPAPTSTMAPPPAGDAEPLLRMARAFVPQMLAEARSGRDGYTWGRWTAAHTKPQFRPHLVMLAEASSEERMQLLTQLEPAFAEHAEWVEEAAEGILDVLQPDDTDNEETDAHSGSDVPDGSAVGGSGRNGDGAGDGTAHPIAGDVATGEGARRAH